MNEPAVFDYSELDSEIRELVQQRADEIRSRLKLTAQEVVEIGERLIEVKSKVGHGKFGKWLLAEFDWTDRTARQFMAVAERFKSENFSDLKIAPSALYLLAAPSTPESARAEVLALAEAGATITYSLARDITKKWKGRTPEDDDDQDPDNSMAVHFSSETPEWYTPGHIVARVIQAMGCIDLDPCSNSHVEPNVPAMTYYTKEDDGLAQPWHGRVYMNPPYGHELGDWVTHLIDEWRDGRVTEAVALVPARTDTAWFSEFIGLPLCFIRGRLRFSGHENSAPFPSMAVYLGPNLTAFVRAFGDIGPIYQEVEEQQDE